MHKTNTHIHNAPAYEMVPFSNGTFDIGMTMTQCYELKAFTAVLWLTSSGIYIHANLILGLILTLEGLGLLS